VGDHDELVGRSTVLVSPDFSVDHQGRLDAPELRAVSEALLLVLGL
jgi:hypothetical protein